MARHAFVGLRSVCDRFISEGYEDPDDGKVLHLPPKTDTARDSMFEYMSYNATRALQEKDLQNIIQLAALDGPQVGCSLSREQTLS